MKARYSKQITFVKHGNKVNSQKSRQNHHAKLNNQPSSTDQLATTEVKNITPNILSRELINSNPVISHTKKEMIEKYYGKNTGLHATTKKAELTPTKNKINIVKSKKHKSNNSIFYAGALALVTALSIAVTQRKNLKKLGKWAHRNPKKTQVLLAGLSVFTFFNSGHIGEALYQANIKIPAHLFEYAFTAFCAGILFHPSKVKGIITAKAEYYKHKASIGLIACSSSLMVLSASYNHISLFDSKWGIDKIVNYKAGTTGFSQEENLKEAASLEKTNIDTVSPDEQEDNSGRKALLIIGMFFCILFAVAAAVAAIIFACWFVCTGEEVLAILCLVGGAALITFLIIAVVKLGRELHDMRVKEAIEYQK